MQLFRRWLLKLPRHLLRSLLDKLQHLITNPYLLRQLSLRSLQLLLLQNQQVQ